ncbi:VCBS repeat-containing protein [Telmatocola sphagniphila]|uniref:VCBS repeat-containing protein n=1 Tax=Telmatocola sphagniphila TaxID=1123043 RepID=A0A8E6ET61_9BACT|nr:VCBS repeat-containing protein [Telmatocola sphagniphila]QVL32014.1 VCBS repeat-containing protein [Telmatocola sphagniphila]
MRFLFTLPFILAGVLVAIPSQPVTSQEKATTTVAWQRIVIDKKFRAEGVAVADVNKDGKIDIMNGEYWYEAPNWTPHEMQPPREYYMGLGPDGKGNNYSHSFACWAEDINGDGYPDLIVIDFPGDPCFWLENPKGKDGHWKKHIIWHSACNETPQYADLFGTGKKVLIMGTQPVGKRGDSNEGQMAYFTPGKDPTALWEMHPISEPSTPPTIKDGKPVPGTGKVIPGTNRFSHGLGVGDVNGDGRLDVICTDGWWEQPKEKSDKPWVFHPARLGEPCSDMFAYDMDGDGKNDIISASAHKFGIWWYHNRGLDAKGNPTFLKQDLFPDLVSETHAMHFVDIDGDGLKDLVTGKRFGSHGYGEPGAEKPAMLYWFKASKDKSGMTQFTPFPIDNDSGVGTQFAVADVNGDGKLDVIVSNKKGVFLHLQK